MAQELTVSGSVAFAKGNVASILRERTGVKFDVTGAKYHAGVQNIGTSEEAIQLGDVGTPGWCYLRNLDATNYVDIRSATGVAACIRLKPGEIAVFRFAGAASAPFAIANSGAVNLEVFIVED